MGTCQQKLPETKARPAVTRKYDLEARNYDAARSNLFFDLAAQTITKMVGSCDGLSVLDVPVGTGRIIPHLLQDHGEPKAYVGVDIAPGMLTQTRERCARMGFKGLRLSLGDVWNLPFRDESFDLVLVLRLFHLFPVHTYHAAIKEIHRILRPGGTLIAEVRNRYRGGMVGFLKEWVDRRNPSELDHYYTRPGQLPDIFSPLRIVESRGIWFDGLQVVKLASHRAASRLHSGLNFRPLCYLSKELAIKAVKE